MDISPASYVDRPTHKSGRGNIRCMFLFWRAGPPLYYVLVSWLYALYSFDYCWSLARARLPDRIHHFQTHSAFFLGARAWGLC